MMAVCTEFYFVNTYKKESTYELRSACSNNNTFFSVINKFDKFNKMYIAFFNT